MSEGKEADSLKRKSGQNQIVAGAQKKARQQKIEDTVTAATDEEVEEFFAILKRIHEAMNYFKNGNSEKRTLTELENTNVDVDGVDNREGKRVEKDVKENVGLDLNAEPETETDSDGA